MADEDIPDELTCPVCFNLPEKEVYQCKDGHVLCSKCYFKMKECPQCRRPLDKNEPIRNRHFEGRLVGLQKVDCAFKGNGCRQKIQKSLIEDHEKGCCFDIKKFGQFINLCKIMNYNCNFRVNKGNTEEAVVHFNTVHGVALAKTEKFRMELLNFKEGTTSGSENLQFWSPVITDLKERKSYLLTMTVYNKMEDSFAFCSIYLPHPNSSPAEFLIEYSMSDQHLNEPLKLSFLQDPVSISNVMNKGALNVPRRFPKMLVDPYFSERGNLQVNCKILDRRVQESSDIESFKCSRLENTIRWNRNQGSPAARKLLDQLITDCNLESNWDNNNWEELLIDKLFTEETLAGIGSQDLQYLKNGAWFVISVFGTQNGLAELLRLDPEVDLTMMNASGATPLHCTMRDKNFDAGLDKALYFKNDLNANVKALDGKKRSLLHWAAWKSGEESVKQFLYERLDVNGVDDEGKTPLHYAMLNPDEASVFDNAVALLHSGADLNLKDNEGSTPMDIADKVKCKCRFQLREMIELFKAGKKPTFKVSFSM